MNPGQCFVMTALNCWRAGDDAGAYYWLIEHALMLNYPIEQSANTRYVQSVLAK